jgi:hypothetical protein
MHAVNQIVNSGRAWLTLCHIHPLVRIIHYDKDCTSRRQLTRHLVFYNFEVPIILMGTLISKMIKPFHVNDT